MNNKDNTKKKKKKLIFVPELCMQLTMQLLLLVLMYHDHVMENSCLSMAGRRDIMYCHTP